MRLPDDPTKFTSQFKYVEVARYWEEKNELPRERYKKDHPRAGDPILFAIEDLSAYIARRGDVGIYTSVFQYNGPDFRDATRLGPMYFDFDDDDLENARRDALEVVRHLLQFVPEGAIRAYFSGKKGFHVECEPIALGISPSDELPGIFRLVAQDLRDTLQLTTMDFVVYDWRRMWRYPNTRHQRTGLFKVDVLPLLLDNRSSEAIVKYAEQPHANDVPEQQFDPRANRWYREYTYKAEQAILQSKQDQQDLLSRFLNDGTGHVRSYDKDRMFDRTKLVNHCSAIKALDAKARETHFLTHYERLFLCSILTYDEEAIKYLHEILSKCDDYNFEISNSHIEDWVKRREYGIGGRPFTCQKASEVGISCSDCATMEPRKKVIRLDDGKYIETEELSLPSPLRWAYTVKENQWQKKQKTSYHR